MADVIAMFAQTLRPWARDLHVHVMDHGGAIVRGYAMSPADVEREDIDVFLVDDVTSYLSKAFVADLHERGVAVAGLYEGTEEAPGRARLLATGADVALEASSPPELIVAEVMRLCASRTPTRRSPAPSDAGSATGLVIAVASAGGGCGSTEVAIAVADALSEERTVTLVDADDQSPGLALRLDLTALPNLRDAIDSAASGSDDLTRLLHTTRDLGMRLLPGLAAPEEWETLRAGDVIRVLAALASDAAVVVANVGGRVEQLPGAGRLARFATARAVIGTADVVLLVSTGTTRGVRLAADWAVAVRGIVDFERVHVILNRHAAGHYSASQLRSALDPLRPSSLTLLPYDRRVLRAEWDGVPVLRGPFRKRVRRLARAVTGATA